MSDLIDRQAAIDVIDKIFPVDPMRNDYTKGITCGAALAMEFIKQLPSAEPKKGSWEHCKDEDGLYDVCSNCGADVDISHYGQSYCYCPYCGAKMEVTE